MFKAQERSVLSTSPYGIPLESESLMLAEARQRGEILVRIVITPIDPQSASVSKMDNALSEIEKILPVVSTIASKTEIYLARALFIVSTDYHYARSLARRSASGFHVAVDEVAWDAYGAVRYETTNDFERESTRKEVSSWKEDLITLYVRSKTAQASLCSAESQSCLPFRGVHAVSSKGADEPAVTLLLFRRKGQLFAIPEYAVKKITRQAAGGFAVLVSMEGRTGPESFSLAADSFVARKSILLTGFAIRKTQRGFSVALGNDWVSFIPPFRNR